MGQNDCKHGMIPSQCALCIDRTKQRGVILPKQQPKITVIPDGQEDGLNLGKINISENGSSYLREVESPNGAWEDPMESLTIEDFPDEYPKDEEIENDELFKGENLSPNESEDTPEIELEPALQIVSINANTGDIEEGVKQSVPETVVQNPTPLVSRKEENIHRPSPMTQMEHAQKQRLQDLPLGMVLQIPVERIRPFHGQPRKHFGGRQLTRLGLSIRRRGQKRPATVKWLPEDRYYFCELIDGERRWRAIQQQELPTLRAIVEEVESEIDQFRTSAISNFGGLGHTPLEISAALERLVQETEDTHAEIAEDFGKSTGWLRQHLSLTRLSPQIRAMMNPELPNTERVKFALALVLTSLPHELQEQVVVELKQKELKGTMANQYVRRRARESGIPQSNNGRSPVKDYQITGRALGTIQERVDLLDAMTPQQIKAMFANRDPMNQDQQEVYNQLESLALQIQKTKEKFSS